MWTSFKICSHCVAVAHCLDCTQDFIGWFTSHSKKLNLTKLCTSNITQNIGKKPSQSRYSQRKAKPPILSWALHSSFTSPSTTTINAPFMMDHVLHHLVVLLVIYKSLLTQIGGVHILINLGVLKCQLLC